MYDVNRWSDEQLLRFLTIRQEFFLDPMGSNKHRFLEAANVLQRALFDWYLEPSGTFDRMLAVVTKTAEQWSALRKEERRTLLDRRFALNTARPDLPAVESSVSEHQWQQIFGSLGLGLREPGTFDRFLVQLDEETNPSLRINHRYMGELLPHDNMISYLSSMTGTFLNENAIIGKVSPCVTHMEQAAVKWLLTLVGWDGALATSEKATTVPLQRLPTLASPAQRHQRWEREEPTGTIVAGGTIANISAMLVARTALFDYLLGWSGAVQWLGPSLAWQLVQDIWKYDQLVVLTSKGCHYSIRKAALQAGVAPGNVIDIAGSANPWILDGKALAARLKKLSERPETVVMAVAAIAGKTETGYVDRLDEIGHELNLAVTLPNVDKVIETMRSSADMVRKTIKSLVSSTATMEAFDATASTWRPDNPDLRKLSDRAKDGNEIENACHNRTFLHVDAAHGGAFLTVPSLRNSVFAGIELADTITIDGHKSFYCYYPCGGLLVRTTRWAQTFSAGHSAYISEDANRGVYREGLVFQRSLEAQRPMTVGQPFDDDANYREDPSLNFSRRFSANLDAVYRLTGRPVAADRSELMHNPFNEYLEGSRGPQGIMQLYFNLSTLGLRGYRALLEWTTLLRARAEEAISLGLSDVRLVTDAPLPEELFASDKQAGLHATVDETIPQPGRPHSGIVPTAGGRFFRLSDGACNQLLISYVPAREAKLIATASADYWKEGGDRELLRKMRYLWRINEHLWNEHIYANPHFTYYLGHTSLSLELPSSKDANAGAEALGALFTKWNAWTRQNDGRCPFFDVLASAIANPEDNELKPYARKFFCQKVILMHPYTDESLVGDMLRRLAFWGERSVSDVRTSDAVAHFLFPPKDLPRSG